MSPDSPATRSSEASLSHAPEETLGPTAFRAIAEFTYDWESWVDAVGRLVWVNAAVERITGYSPTECLEMETYPLPLIHPEDRPRLEEVCRRAERGESENHIEFRTLSKDGKSRWAAISYQPLVDSHGRRTGYRSSVRDIEERKQMEARLREALAAAEEANLSKTRFLASISHELRTPLQSIMSHAELLFRAGLPAELRDYAEAVTREGEHLARLVGDLLDYSALEAGGLTVLPRSFSPAEEFRPRLTSLARKAKDKGLDFHFELGDPHARVESDPDRCLQILTNLVSNAIQYTAEGRIEVIVRVDSDLTVVVSDTGPGLPPGIELFQPFRRGHPDAQTGGFGLGLAISARLCERLGGSLTAQSNAEGGTTMVASFPIGAPSQQVGRARRAPGEPALVVIVDDTGSSRAALTHAAEALGHQVRKASTLKEALAIEEQRSPDLILLDLNMPGPDVTEKALALRQRFGSGPRLLVMSAGGIGADQAALKEAGVDSFVQKPISLETLTRLISASEDAGYRRSSRPAPGTSAPSAAETWDLERWAELESFKDPEGRSLGQRISARLDEDVAALSKRLRRAATESEIRGYQDALHELRGLVGLLGASFALDSVRRLEQLAETRGERHAGEAVELLETMQRGFLERFPLH
jgi:PAS domain S-box-containing protein